MEIENELSALKTSVGGDRDSNCTTKNVQDSNSRQNTISCLYVSSTTDVLWRQEEVSIRSSASRGDQPVKEYL